MFGKSSYRWQIIGSTRKSIEIMAKIIFCNQWTKAMLLWFRFALFAIKLIESHRLNIERWTDSFPPLSTLSLSLACCLRLCIFPRCFHYWIFVQFCVIKFNFKNISVCVLWNENSFVDTCTYQDRFIRSCLLRHGCFCFFSISYSAMHFHFVERIARASDH